MGIDIECDIDPVQYHLSWKAEQPCSGWERVFPIREFKGGVGPISYSLDTTFPASYHIADIHPDSLIIHGYEYEPGTEG